MVERVSYQESQLRKAFQFIVRQLDKRKDQYLNFFPSVPQLPWKVAPIFVIIRILKHPLNCIMGREPRYDEDFGIDFRNTEQRALAIAEGVVEEKNWIILYDAREIPEKPSHRIDKRFYSLVIIVEKVRTDESIFILKDHAIQGPEEGVENLPSLRCTYAADQVVEIFE